MKALIVIGVCALGAGIAFVAMPVTATTKPRQAQLQAGKKIVEGWEKHEAALWKPVEVAMSKGDIPAVKVAFAAYKSAKHFGYYDPTFPYERAGLAKFYYKRGDIADAKTEMDALTAPITKTSKFYGGIEDADFMWIWLHITEAPQARKDELLNIWSDDYRSHSMKPGAYPELGPEALLEYVEGQYGIGGMPDGYKAAAQHFERATMLAPNSLQAAQGLALALSFAGDKEGAKQAAIRASRLMMDSHAKSAFLRSYGVTKEYLEKLKP
ncbi:MAG TPA: hypothetical protein VHE55_03635 [Fimbriimonadaceae bacterium]|nr:hypothetical protein [Fimbriimonadaceae bacterium]